MAALTNPKHEAFALAVASAKVTGINGTQAYRNIFGAKGASAEVGAAKLRAKLSHRIDELRLMATGAAGKRETQIADALAEQFKGHLLTMAERRAFLARVVRVDMTKIDLVKDGDLIQEIITTITEAGSTTKLKLPGKRECILLDAELAGEMDAKGGLTVNVGVQVAVMPEDRRQTLMERRRAAIEAAKITTN